MFHHSALPPRRPKAGFTARQLEVLGLVAIGYSNPEISRCLKISVDTVKTHIGQLMGRLTARNRTHLVLCAHARGLLVIKYDGPQLVEATCDMVSTPCAGPDGASAVRVLVKRRTVSQA